MSALSRAALMTGRYQTRSGIYPGVLAANSIGGAALNALCICICKSVVVQWNPMLFVGSMHATHIHKY